jgi:glutathione peroxidase
MTNFDVDIDAFIRRPADLDHDRGRAAPRINVAPHCGSTPQHAGLQSLDDTCADRLAAETEPQDGQLVAVVESLLPR